MSKPEVYDGQHLTEARATIRNLRNIIVSHETTITGLQSRYNTAVAALALMQEQRDSATAALAAAEARATKLEEAANLAIRGWRRWKRESKRGGNRVEADHGLDDLGQGIWDLIEILYPDRSNLPECPKCGTRHIPGANSFCSR